MTLVMSYSPPSAVLACHHGFVCEPDTHIEEFSPLSTRQFSAGYGSGFEDGEKSEDSLAFDIAIHVGSGLLAGAAGAFVPSTPMYCRLRWSLLSSCRRTVRPRPLHGISR